MLKIAIIGVGTVGSSVANILRDNKRYYCSTGRKRVSCPSIGVVNNLNKKRDVHIELTDDIDKVLQDDSIDIVVELMGGTTKAYDVVKKL